MEETVVVGIRCEGDLVSVLVGKGDLHANGCLQPFQLDVSRLPGWSVQLKVRPGDGEQDAEQGCDPWQPHPQRPCGHWSLL